MREGLRGSPLDQAFQAPQMVELATPPRVLTMDQSFPTVQEEAHKKLLHQQALLDSAGDGQLQPNGHL